MTTHALMELAIEIANDMDNYATDLYHGGGALYDFAERVRALGKAAEAATQLRTAAAEGGEEWPALHGLWRAMIDAGGATTVARWGAGNNSDKWTADVTAGMLAIERHFHPERFDGTFRDKPPTDSGAGRDGVNYEHVVRLLDAGGFIVAGKVDQAIYILHPEIRGSAIAGAAGEG